MTTTMKIQPLKSLSQRWTQQDASYFTEYESYKTKLMKAKPYLDRGSMQQANTKKKSTGPIKQNSVVAGEKKYPFASSKSFTINIDRKSSHFSISEINSKGDVDDEKYQKNLNDFQNGYRQRKRIIRSQSESRRDNQPMASNASSQSKILGLRSKTEDIGEEPSSRSPQKPRLERQQSMNRSVDLSVVTLPPIDKMTKNGQKDKTNKK